MKLMNHVYQIGGISLSHFFDASAYLLEGDNGLYLIDCGTPEGFDAICRNIKASGFSPDQIKAIYATHGHYDHIGAAALFQERFGCRLYLHKEDQKQVEKGDGVRTTAQLLYGKDFPVCRVDGTVGDADILEFGGKFTARVLHTPGHTPGSVCYALDIDGFSFLIAGDTLHGGFSEKIGSDEMRWKESLEKLSAEHFDAFTFGHVGANVICDADARIAEMKRQFGIYYNPWFKAMKDSFRYA